MLRSRRRSPYDAYLCAVISVVLLLLSVSLLHSRLSRSHHLPRPSLVSHSSVDISTAAFDDPIDEVDFIDETLCPSSPRLNPPPYLYFDPLSASIRRSFLSPPSSSLHHHHHSANNNFPFQFSSSDNDDPSKTAFASDDVPVDFSVRSMAARVATIEDALLLKNSPLREGWSDWFDKKSDPNGTGATGLTRGDRIVQKWWIHEFKKVPFPGIKKVPLNIVKANTLTKVGTEHRTLNHNNNNNNDNDNNHEIIKEAVNSGSNGGESSIQKHVNVIGDARGVSVKNHVCADGDTWGYYPGLPLLLSFSDFLLVSESLLFHHPDACVVVFSEMVELDFFKESFVKDGYKVAVAILRYKVAVATPMLDELLKDMPAHIFATVWFEWKKTGFCSTHYSELIHLAALYNLFIKECLEEFNMTYDDTSLRGNGVDPLTRVDRKYLGEENKSVKHLELKVEPSYIFIPVSSQNITRSFIAPSTETQKALQDVLLENILHNSLTFHFWNSVTFSLIPEPDSLVSKLLNYAFIQCSELPWMPSSTNFVLRFHSDCSPEDIGRFLFL
ncbi:hypothetical protein JHK87_019378 [Glycine soja]|nr:hypothetical protein JHK87_019378 [Glycine soja]